MSDFGPENFRLPTPQPEAEQLPPIAPVPLRIPPEFFEPENIDSLEPLPTGPIVIVQTKLRSLQENPLTDETRIVRIDPVRQGGPFSDPGGTVLFNFNSANSGGSFGESGNSSRSESSIRDADIAAALDYARTKVPADEGEAASLARLRDVLGQIGVAPNTQGETQPVPAQPVTPDTVSTQELPIVIPLDVVDDADGGPGDGPDDDITSLFDLQPPVDRQTVRQELLDALAAPRPRRRILARLGAAVAGAAAAAIPLRLSRRDRRPVDPFDLPLNETRFRDRLDQLLDRAPQDGDLLALYQTVRSSRQVTPTDRVLARRFPAYIRLRNAVREVNLGIKGRLVQGATAVLPRDIRDSSRQRFLRSAAQQVVAIDALDQLIQPNAADATADQRASLPPRPRGFEVRQASNAQAVAEAAQRVLLRQLERTPLKAIVETLRGDPARRERVEATLRKAGRTVLTLAGVEEQRSLQPWEREYIRTIAPLTAVNPYVLTTGREAPEVTKACMDAYYDNLINDTRERLPSGSRVRMVVLGTGEHGTIAASELMRIRPDLFDDPGADADGNPNPEGVVFVDRMRRPSGTFGYPNGRAFRMNSGVPLGDNWFALPEAINNQPDMVRAYGGAFRGYPGEREIGVNRMRPWSINRGADWMVPVDAYARERYPYNDEKALSTEIQASLLCRNFLGGSELYQVYENNDTSIPEEFIVVLNDYDEAGNMIGQRTLYTDNIVVATGKNRPRRAFRNNTEFQNLMRLNEAKAGFPYYTTALEAYKAVGDETVDGPIEHGGVFVLGGDGNGVEVGLEAIARQIETGNLDPALIEKIYVVGPNATTKIACRPRYRALLDLLNRTGRPNVVDLIDDRLDAVFTVPDGQNKVKITLTNENGENVRDSFTGQPIYADHIIDSVGFRLDIESEFAQLLDADGEFSLAEALEDITIPGTTLAVGQRLRRRPNVMFVGTAAKPGFTPERLADLPPTSAEVLQLVGAENAVAIGFVGGNTQASTFINAQEGLKLPAFNPNEVGRTTPQTTVLPTDITIQRGKGLNVGLPLDRDGLPRTRRTVPRDGSALRPLMLMAMPEHTIDIRTKKQYSIRVRMGDNGFAVRAMQSVPQSVLEVVGASMADRHFRAYAEREMGARFGSKRELDIVVTYDKGKLVMEETFVQAM
jgi:hypothetical protein